MFQSVNIFRADGGSGGILTTDTSLGGLSAATIKFPYMGLYNISWSVRYNAATTENQAWLAPIVWTFGGETANNSGGTRLGVSSTNSYTITASYTGYFNANETLGLQGYSSTNNYLATSGNATTL